MRILGIDEAGRGAAIGPMILTCFSIDEADVSILKKLNVRDSKRVAKKQVQQLYLVLTGVVKEDGALLTSQSKSFSYSTYSASAQLIDKFVHLSNLNNLERKIGTELASIEINKIQKENPEEEIRVIFDSNQIFYQAIDGLYKKYNTVDFIAMNKADERFLPVAAASIISKARRDILATEIMNGRTVGAGYPNKETEKWIRSWYFADRNKYIDKVRHTWSWWKRLQESLEKEDEERKEDFFL